VNLYRNEISKKERNSEGDVCGFIYFRESSFVTSVQDERT